MSKVLRRLDHMKVFLSIKWIGFFVCSLVAENIEVHLPTSSNVKRIYMSRIRTDEGERDWRYFDELREVLEFDLNAGGFVKVAAIRPESEDLLGELNVHKGFRVNEWRKGNISFVLSLDVDSKRLSLTLFDIDKAVAKNYAPIALSGKLEVDRRSIHRFSDALHKDLFGVEGIASLRILYAQRFKNPSAEGLSWLSEIWICDADGENARQLTDSKGYCMSPLFLPKKESDPRFLYVFHGDGQSKIFRASLAKPKEKEEAIVLRGNQALPSISQNGKHLAFIADTAGRPDLFLQSFDEKGHMVGKARQLYSAPHATQASSTFSPDGKRVAFVSDKDGYPTIYLLELRESKNTVRPKPWLITKKNRENTAPAWSPNGKMLAYAAKTQGVRQIWIYDFELKEERQLTTGSETKENPAWAPDSLHLIYNTESDVKSELYLLHIRDPEPVCISRGFGQKRFACWETRQMRLK